MLEDGILTIGDEPEIPAQDGEELAGNDQEPSVPAEPTEEAEEAEVTSEAGGEAAEEDLTQSANFRRYQAKRDKEIARLQAELKRQRQAQEQQEITRLQGEINALLEQAATEEDAEQRRKMLEDVAARQGYLYHLQYKQWEAYKRGRLREAGLDPDDERFDKQYRTAEEFERDLARAELEMLRAQKKQVGQGKKPSPRVDTGEPEVRGGHDLMADIRLLNSGRMSPQEFVKRWGRR